MSTKKSTIMLFDIDNTLTQPRGKISPDMLSTLKLLQNHVDIGIIGGSDFEKQKQQIGDYVLDWVDYSFSQNGLVAYKHGELIHSNSITDAVDPTIIKHFINYC